MTVTVSSNFGGEALYRIGISFLAAEKFGQSDPRFAALMDSFQNCEEPVENIAHYIRQGYPYCAWFSGRKKAENFVLGQHIAVDLDTGDSLSAIDTVCAHPFVKLYGALVHTTPSHTTEQPRCRALFLLDEPIRSATGYAAAVRFVAEQFAGADLSATDAARFFWGCNANSKQARVEIINRVLPLRSLRALYAQWKIRDDAVKKRAAQLAGRGKAGSSSMYPQRTEAEEIASVTEALKRIDPWGIDYTTWVSVLAALHDSLGDAALPIAVEWAQGKPQEVESKWKTFGRSSGNVATLGTVYYLAGGARD